ncbi:DUF2306 domain-containing protein [Alteromonas lipolytica]|uniref:DUF2306 domain-containing protein n=1 Tax=Alteromonas lipolytica TaxID=1856405 RepID=A0A1E8FH26_9ALTE|nr:DUF2306 domain-containing protein [Alteromonas lipolytica]OFI35257.1 hypothetical protein BFC17_17130 [Alteromonas lipolytica]GGF58046.1 hypothetical protein GCM10011338_07880 [Alteromonas lipolytica]
MTDTVSASAFPQTASKEKIKSGLSLAVKGWLIAALIGQWIFALYIFKQFALPLINGSIDESMYTYMIRGYINGDTFNNALLLLHVVPVILINLAAFIQFLPGVRQRLPKLHRLNGRVYFTVGLMGAFGGLYMTWITGSRLSVTGALGVTLNGVLIIVAVYYAWKYARARQFAQHRRFAVHAFILINGVWTFRLYLMSWFMINQGPMGNNATLNGPADIILSFASYLLPMAVAELVMRAEKSRHSRTVITASLTVVAMFLLTVAGTFAATIMMWGPRIIS